MVALISVSQWLCCPLKCQYWDVSVVYLSCSGIIFQNILEGITGFDALFFLYFRSLCCCRQINVISCIWFGVEPMMI